MKRDKKLTSLAMGLLLVVLASQTAHGQPGRGTFPRPGGSGKSRPGSSGASTLNRSGIREGMQMPAVKVFDDQGKEFNTSSLKGSYTVLTFGCLT